MAWTDTLLDASYRGVSFDVVSDRVDVQRRLHEHEYPLVDGADIDDLGLSARKITLPVIVFGNDYENRLQKLVAALDEPGPGELVHPVYGSLRDCLVERYSVSHDPADAIDAARLEIVFVPAIPRPPFFDRELPDQQADRALDQVEAIQSQNFEIFRDVVEALAPFKTRLDAFTALARGVINQVARGVGGVKSLITALTAPTTLVSDMMSVLRNLGDWRAIDPFSAVAGYRDQLNDLRSLIKLPGRLSPTDHPSGAPPFQPVERTRHTAPEQQVLEQVLQTAVAAAAAERVVRVLQTEITSPTLTPVDVEVIVGEARTAIAAAIQVTNIIADSQKTSSAPNATAVEPILIVNAVALNTLIESLRNLAALVQDLGIEVINLRPPIVRRIVEADSNLHLIASRWYNDYTRAAELRRLNPQVRHPSFVRAGVELNAYAE